MQQARNPLILLGVLYLSTLLALWPGVISPDAMGQYSAAIAGVYSDHHPPAMSILWRYLDKIYPGSGLLFALHLTLLYAAATIFVYIFRSSKFKWWYAVYPLIPNMLAYTVFIVKDSSFVYSYLLASAIISYLIVSQQTKYKWLLLSLCLLLLFYGTAAKFQARYLLVFFTFGIAYCIDYRLKIKNILIGIGLYVAILAAMFSMNTYLVPSPQQSHSWQYVKLYDLTAISLYLETPLYPEFIKEDPSFNFSKINDDFDPQKIDDLVFPSDAALHLGSNDKQRTELWDYWFYTIKQHPWLYLKARFRLWSYNLTSVPSEYNDPVKFLKNTALRPLVNIPWIETTIDVGYKFVNRMLQFLWLLPLLLFYCYLGVRNFNQSKYSIPLTMFNFASLALLLVLMFFAMAGVARYVLLCVCLVHASHGFAYRAYKKAP